MVKKTLTDSQLKYAALDVEYLLHLYIEQREDLVTSNKLEWFYEDIEMLINNIFNTDTTVKDLKEVFPGQKRKILCDFNREVLHMFQ